MKLNKNVIESAVLLSLAAALAITAVVSDASVVRAYPTVDRSLALSTDSECNGVAGISEILSSSFTAEEVYNTVTVEKTEVSFVTAGIEENNSLVNADIVLTEEQTAWLDYLFADVADKLNVREAATTDSDIVGKLGSNQRATIIERGDEWTKIKSGNVEGYVYNRYCIFGVDALAYAQEALDKAATAKVDVNVRTKMSADSEIMDTIEKGDSLIVSRETPSENGWIPVIVGDSVGYVCAEYVIVDYKVGHAITIEEEEEIEKQRKLEEMKRKQTAPPNKVYGSAVEASEEELELLAAILVCEAGSSYEGMVAVGAVIMNRLKSSEFPNSISGVIYSRGQFTPAWTGMLDRQLARGSGESAYRAAKAALAGEDPTNGCLFFRSVNSGHSGYVIGDNVFFYRE